MKIPVAMPDLRGNEEKYVVDAVRSSWVGSKGEFIQRFEQEFAQACGTRYAISVCNGTVALHLALLGMNLHPGDEVLVPSLTYVATANAVRYVGAEPVFVDVDPRTWCLDPQNLEASFTRRTRGIIAVDLYGHPADMDAINEFANLRGLWVLEDAAEAHLGRYKGRPVGSLSLASTFSFYGNKIITSGEGGAVTLDDPNLEARLRFLRDQATDPYHRYYFPTVGYNFRLTNLACALLCAQLERQGQFLEYRHHIYQAYQQGLQGVPGIGFQPVAPSAELAPWLFCITVDERAYGRTRDELIAYLEAAGIETRPFFVPLHQLPAFREESAARHEHLPVTETLSSTGMNLPTYNQLEDSQIDYICEAIRKGKKGRPRS